jgi:hypothetical protein
MGRLGRHVPINRVEIFVANDLREDLELLNRELVSNLLSPVRGIAIIKIFPRGKDIKTNPIWWKWLRSIKDLPTNGRLNGCRRGHH